MADRDTAILLAFLVHGRPPGCLNLHFFCSNCLYSSVIVAHNLTLVCGPICGLIDLGKDGAQGRNCEAWQVLRWRWTPVGRRPDRSEEVGLALPLAGQSEGNVLISTESWPGHGFFRRELTHVRNSPPWSWQGHRSDRHGVIERPTMLAFEIIPRSIRYLDALGCRGTRSANRS